jgi:hypothetical protein
MATQLQLSMLRAIPRSDYQPLNGRDPETFEDTDWVWADGIIETQQDKGTFASLVNAGWAEHNGHDEEDACVRLTRAGFEEYKREEQTA